MYRVYDQRKSLIINTIDCNYTCRISSSYTCSEMSQALLVTQRGSQLECSHVCIVFDREVSSVFAQDPHTLRITGPDSTMGGSVSSLHEQSRRNIPRNYTLSLSLEHSLSYNIATLSLSYNITIHLFIPYPTENES